MPSGIGHARQRLALVQQHPWVLQPEPSCRLWYGAAIFILKRKLKLSGLAQMACDAALSEIANYAGASELLWHWLEADLHHMGFSAAAAIEKLDLVLHMHGIGCRHLKGWQEVMHGAGMA